jgi:SAM-dependent methyltransferase
MSHGQPTELGARQADLNVQHYRSADHVAEYANRILRPAEAVILARYREALSGRVLELGCGAGRLIGYFVAMGGEVHGIDVSRRMVDYCRERYPEAHVRLGDLTELSATVDGRFDAIFASYNVLDVLSDQARRAVLSDLRERLASGGRLIFSSHNLAYIEEPAGTGARWRARLGKLDRPPSSLVRKAMRLPVRVRNRRRLAALQLRAPDYWIVNDEAFDYGLLHYYIRRDDQASQLSDLGYELIECLDLDGERVGDGQVSRSPELHYIARGRA